MKLIKIHKHVGRPMALDPANVHVPVGPLQVCPLGQTLCHHRSLLASTRRTQSATWAPTPAYTQQEKLLHARPPQQEQLKSMNIKGNQTTAKKTN